MATAATTPAEVYIITTKATLPLSKLTAFNMLPPDANLGGYFDNWGIRMFFDGMPIMQERFESEGDAFAARDALNGHLTGSAVIEEHQNWNTVIWNG